MDGRETTCSRVNGPAPGGKPAQAGDLRNSVLAYLVVDLLSYGRREQRQGIEFVGLLKGPDCMGTVVSVKVLCQQVVLRLLRQHSVFVFHYSTNLHVEYAAVLLDQGRSLQVRGP